MQLAMLFESTGRASEIGFRDDPDTYMHFKRAALEHWDEYIKTLGIADATHRDCTEAQAHMYYEPGTATQRILEVCHEMDLFRCFGQNQIQDKLRQITVDIGAEAVTMLASRAVHAILAPGARLHSSLSGFTRDYDKPKFTKYSSDPQACLAVVQDALLKGEAVPGASNTVVLGEGGVRFVGSRFKLLLTAQQTIWRIQQWEDSKVRIQRPFVLKACNDLIDEFCKVHGITHEQADSFKDEVDAIATKETRIEDVAVRLWTSLHTLGGRELCSIINEGVRSEGHWHEGHFQENAMQRPAVLLACLIQIHLNRGRRIKAEEQKDFVWPTGEEKCLNEVSEKNAVFRGSGMPPDPDKQEELLGFYEALADSSCTGPTYSALNTHIIAS
jgi:hypothetical protein